MKVVSTMNRVVLIQHHQDSRGLSKSQ